MKEKQETVEAALEAYGLSVLAEERSQLRTRLIHHVNHLLLHDFEKLVQVLYRVDVEEKELKDRLQRPPATDAAALLADLLIERQEAKHAARGSFKREDNIPEDERW